MLAIQIEFVLTVKPIARYNLLREKCGFLIKNRSEAELWKNVFGLFASNSKNRVRERVNKIALTKAETNTIARAKQIAS